jgi:hypothetical protein
MRCPPHFVLASSRAKWSGAALASEPEDGPRLDYDVNAPDGSRVEIRNEPVAVAGFSAPN